MTPNSSHVSLNSHCTLASFERASQSLGYCFVFLHILVLAFAVYGRNSHLLLYVSFGHSPARLMDVLKMAGTLFHRHKYSVSINNLSSLDS